MEQMQTFKREKERNMEYLLLVIGFVLLIKGADFFVDGSSSVAKIMHIPSIIIGLTVVAFGTSMPELSVSFSASLQGANELAVGNVVGSNIFNVLVVLGVSALMMPVVANKDVMKKEFPFSILITVVLFLVMGGYNLSKFANSESTFTLGRIGGVILLLFFAFFMYSTITDALKARNAYEETEDEEEYKVLSPLKSAIFIVGGAAGIGIGGDMVVDSASIIGATFGMSDNLIGLTIVALGTSLPELVTTVVAAKKGENDLALGNVVGSNVFNVLLILGTASVVFPITVTTDAMCDMIMAILASVLVFVLAKTKGTISRIEGAIFLTGYVAFFVYILCR